MDSAINEKYKDDILDITKNQERKYQIIQNPDGTVSLKDVTQYIQMGDEVGAKEINAICQALLQMSLQLGGYTFAPTCTQAQYDAMPSHPDGTIYFTT